MKKYVMVVMFIPLLLHSQSWQWGKRGGSLNQISNESQYEQTYFLTTDSQKNVYGLSYVGATGLNIDSNVKTNHDGNSFGPVDIALFSFSCNGTYRWSKIIGGNSNETVNAVCVDAQDNVYIAGRLGYCGDPNYPPRIDNDVVISQNPMDCRAMFIAKYNTNGVLQWIKQPQVASVTQTEDSGAHSRGLVLDGEGNLNWLAWLPTGSYADGGYVNSSTERKMVVLKYNTSGDFMSVLPLDMQLTQGAAVPMQFQRNPYNGNFYFYSYRASPSDNATIGGVSVTGNSFISCFNAQGVFQWVREDTAPDSGYLFIYNLAFDPQNNIYIGGLISGLNLVSFLGFSVSETIIPGFVMKTNPDASQVLWSTYHNKGSQNRGAIVLKGNELAFTSYGFGVDFTWGTQTLNISGPNQGQEAILARFNKDTGACIGLTKVPGSLGFNDHGAALTVDASGDYILGGYMGGTLFFNNNQQITNIGSQSDFFVAKYATEACQPLSVVDQDEKRITLYPNPTRDRVQFDNSQAGITRVSVYNYLGQEVMLPLDCTSVPEVTIEMSGLSKGVYLVRLEGAGVSNTVKVMRE